MYCTTSSRAGVLLMYLYYLLLINLGSWQIVANQFGLMLPVASLVSVRGQCCTWGTYLYVHTLNFRELPPFLALSLDLVV
jgi:hypothetical protein